ncbi:MAG: chitobiase/beta-hexosaminidase C-terminal domain-containing protein [Bacteroidales bacterium]|nr:chitobiase/beta-hexosaminidase C-terminal domain-containing protein [Bacteroidales bacterium]
MKNIFKLFVPVAVAALALVSCQNEANGILGNDPGAVTIRVHASANELAADDETKTYLGEYNSVENTVLWGTGEYMKLAVTAGESTVFANSTDASADLFDGEPAALFEFSVSPASAASYLYQGLYPASAAVANSNTNPASYKVNLPATQNATATSYDPAAYIMVAQPDTFDAVETDWNVKFRRATALNKITLKNVPDGKSINRVTITAPSGKYLAGARHFDLSAGTSGDIYSGGGRTESVDVKFASALSGINVNVWFTSWDVEVAESETLTIVVYTTDKKSYSKVITVPAGKSIKFQEGFLNTLGVSLSGITPEDVNELEEGNYVVLAKDGENYYALKAEKEDGKERLLSVAYTGSLASYNGDADMIWSLTKSGDSFIFENDSKYLGYKGSSNESYWLAADENWTADNYLLDVTYQNENSAYYVTLHSNASRYLSKNSSGAFFAFYGNTGQKADIVFVPATVDTRADVTLTFDDDVVNLTPADAASYLGQDVTASPNVTAITEHLSWQYEDNDGVIDEFDNGALTLTGNEGTATVTVSFAGDENYRPAEASYTITVSAASGPEYVLVSTANDVVAGDYIITWENTYYLPSGSTSGTNPAVGSGITVANNKITNTVTSDMVWTFTGDNTNGFTISDGTNILHSTNAAQGISIDTTSTRKWTVSVDGTYGMLLHGDDGGSRYLAVYNSGSWRYYATGNSYSGTLRLYKYVAAQDNRQEAGMSWSSDSATATYSNGNSLSFTAPNLTAGNASGITYESTDETIATINASGVVSITALSNNDVKEGSTTIKAVFAGDTNYKPQTVSYSLTVVDSRSAVATPTFDPAAGEVAANTTVNFQCADSDVTYHYTVNGSDPTVESPTAASVTIDAAKTVKVLATKTGYKPSDIATAAYTIQGVQANDGSLDHPYTVAEALAIIDGYSDKEKSSSQVYVSGIVANVGSYNSTYNSVTYDISDDGQNSNTLNVYSGKFVANTNFASNEQIEAGDVVIVYGYLYLYGSTKEMYQNNYIYSLNGITTLPTITKTDITGVDAAGVNNATKAVSFANNDGWTASVTADGTIVTSASISGTTITYSVAANSGDARTGSIIVALSKSGRAYVSATISVSQLAGNGNTSSTDTITSGTFSGSSTSISMTTAEGVTISQLKDDGTNVNTSYNTVSTLRVYKANQMQFTGKTFTRIEMYYTGSYSGASWTVSAGDGTVSIDTTNKKVVWENNSGATTVTLKNSTTSGTNTQLRTTKFVVTYN